MTGPRNPVGCAQQGGADPVTFQADFGRPRLKRSLEVID
jgi:hypothetical protein